MSFFQLSSNKYNKILHGNLTDVDITTIVKISPKQFTIQTVWINEDEPFKSTVQCEILSMDELLIKYKGLIEEELENFNWLFS